MAPFNFAVELMELKSAIESNTKTFAALSAEQRAKIAIETQRADEAYPLISLLAAEPEWPEAKKWVQSYKQARGIK